MADEFLVTVVVGLALLSLLLLVTNAQFFFGPKDRGVAPPVIASKIMDLDGFAATFVKETRTYDLGSKEVSNGILFGENKIRYHTEAPEIESAVIKFRIKRTNNLGPLFVRVNGKLVEAKYYAVGDYTIVVPKELLNESLTVEISAMSSLWQIWAPNLYDVRSASVAVRSFSLRPAEFEFDLAEEYLTFKEGRVEFSLDENTGRLVVLLNGKEIFNDFARSAQSVSFSKEQAKIGTNKLRIVPSRGSRFVGTARMVVFYEK